MSVSHPGDSLTRPKRILYIVVLGALVGLGPFTIDLYLPAFPALTEDFGVGDAVIQLTLTGTTIGFGLGQLFVGPWSDRVGRRIPLLVATGLHIVASLGAALSPDVVVLGGFRVLQGIGAAGGGVVAMAMVRDMFGGRPLVRMLSRLALVTSLAPILAPVIGSQLLRITDWRGIFYVLAAYGLFVLLAAGLSIGETMPARGPDAEARRTVGERYRALFTDRIFVGIALLGGMMFSGLFSYLSASPFLFQEVFDLSPQEFGLLFGINSVGILVGNQTASRLTKVVGPQWILACTTAVQVLSSAAIVIGVLLGFGFVGIVIPLFLFILCCGFAFPCIQVIALAHHGKEAGTAASILGAANFGLAGLISPVVGALGISSALPMGSVMLATALIGTASLWFIVRPRTVPALED
ncbi:multidrug effflux MFS transporter [Amnibacterium flavum]|uniref:Bcr/CflA family drug resistance efflux transporter n=1 Tax=Amnibacterium flavum TaxID=2173173 RepID=A0A2V1HWV1_9MICO|nr:multidrug effflux MFS transporter [Amnibacterium flavum]PVZ95719.1 Bcr/CflA family drug resistance efflux transporter [Amnibacterium flavum]